MNKQRSGAVISSFEYLYDASGHRIQVKEKDGSRVRWEYDEAYQLLSERRTGTDPFNLSYTYDCAGNRTQKRDGSVTTSYFYDGANRLLRESDGTDTTTYTYDRAGNRTRKQSPLGDIAYTWDAAGRMTRVDNGATIDYQYNADGQRVLRDTGSEYARYLYDFSKLLQENDADGVEEATYTSSHGCHWLCQCGAASELSNQNRGQRSCDQDFQTSDERLLLRGQDFSD